MSAKQYLKMADGFKSGAKWFGDALREETGAADELINSAVHAINSHDELVAENERLRNALEYATNHIPDTTEMVPDGCAVLMTLDEAIDHANEKSIGSSQCAAQHAQLAKWLTDYRAMLAAAPKHEGGAS